VRNRWTKDGPDWIYGSWSVHRPGGFVMWHRLGWKASASMDERRCVRFKRVFKNLEAARRAVEKWLARMGFGQREER
jgi:hypothetical protein